MTTLHLTAKSGHPFHLCDNEACERHTLVKPDGEGTLRFVGGFQTAVLKIDLMHADPKEGLRLCRACRPAYNMKPRSLWSRFLKLFR